MALVGASFRTARVEARERIARRLAELRDAGIQSVDARVQESVILETCNRLELYLVCTEPHVVTKSFVERLCDGSSPEDLFVETGVEAIGHLFRVASGLDSPVLGEEQILEQVRDAGRTARTDGQAKSILSSLFDAAYSSGRRIRTSYRVPPANKSVSAFALKHTLKELGHMPSKVLLIGSGETAKLAAPRLRGSTVYLLSARKGVVDKFPNAVRIPRRALREVAGECDLIVTATRKRGYVITKRDILQARKTVILDLGFPRNVDPSVRSESVRLYDLDAVAKWALTHRVPTDGRVQELVEAETRRFDAWLTASRLAPTLAAIYRWAESVRAEETLAALRRLPDLSQHDRTVIEGLSKRLTGKLLHPHAKFVKEIDEEDEQSERLLLLESIFREGIR